MQGQQYQEVSAYFSETKAKSSIVKTVHDITPGIIFVFYPMQLLYLLFRDGFQSGIGSTEFLKFLIIPTGLFLILLFVRNIINAKRPFEVFNYTPAIEQNTKGKSFPSCITAFCFTIGIGFMYLSTSLGIVMLVLAAIVGLSRFLSGRHFIKDVISGALIGSIVGVLGFFII